MEILELIVEGIKYALPALLVYLTVRYLNESRRRDIADSHRLVLRDEVMKQQLPLRVSAHERAVLFLERISPQHLLMRVRPSGQPAKLFQAMLLKEIQEEFEHNLAQQIYLSPHAWAALVQAKDEVISQIHASIEGLSNEANDLEFSRKLIEKYASLSEFNTQIAINELKKDIRSVFKV